MIMRRYAVLLLLAACSTTPSGPPPEDVAPVEARFDASLHEVRVARAAAEDALKALSAYGNDEAGREVAIRIPSAANRDDLETQLEAHAKKHRLDASQLRLAPITMSRLDFPAAVHPATPYPVQPRDTLVEIPFRFALTPMKEERIRAFLETLPDEARTLIEVRDVHRGVDFVEVQAVSWIFRPIDPVPVFRFETPSLEKQLSETGTGEISAETRAVLEERQRELEAEVDQTNEILSSLSEQRLRAARLDAFLAARERARSAAMVDWFE